MDKKYRQRIMIRIGDLIEHECKSCEHHGKATNQTVCTGCRHGKELRRLGEMLEGVRPIPTIEKGEKNMALTVERYAKLKKDGKSDRVIAKEFGMDHNAMYRFKKEHGLINKPNVKPEKKEVLKEEKVDPSKEYETLMKELKQQLAEKERELSECKNTEKVPVEETNPSLDNAPICEEIELTFEQALDKVLNELKETLIQKNKHYGNSFFNQIDEWGPAAIMIPIANKTDRLKTLYKNGDDVQEPITDSLKDLSGYGVLSLVHKKLRG